MDFEFWLICAKQEKINKKKEKSSTGQKIGNINWACNYTIRKKVHLGEQKLVVGTVPLKGGTKLPFILKKVHITASDL